MPRKTYTHVLLRLEQRMGRSLHCFQEETTCGAVDFLAERRPDRAETFQIPEQGWGPQEVLLFARSSDAVS